MNKKTGEYAPNKIIIYGNPISVNKLYQGRRYLTPEGKGIKEVYKYEASKYIPKGYKPMDGEVRLRMHFFFKNKMSDIDNALKGFLDSMSGILWVDDRQISYIELFKSVDKEKPRIELEILKKTNMKTNKIKKPLIGIVTHNWNEAERKQQDDALLWLYSVISDLQRCRETGISKDFWGQSKLL